MTRAVWLLLALLIPAFGRSVGAQTVPDPVYAFLQPTGEVRVVWTDNVDDESRFRIQGSMDGQNWTNLTLGTTDPASDSEEFLLAPTTFTQIRVGAVRAGNSITWIGTTVVQATYPPKGLRKREGHGSGMTVTWHDLSDDETSFEVQTRLGTAAWVPTFFPADSNRVVLTDLDPETTYQVRVRAWVGPRTSQWSDVLTTSSGSCAVIAAPTGLNVIAKTPTTVTLGWSASASTVNRYRVAMFQGSVIPPSENDWVGVSGNLPANTTMFTVTGLTPSTHYYFKVRAGLDTCYSAYTHELGTTTPSGLPAAPSNLDATARGMDWIDIAWVNNETVGVTGVYVSVRNPDDPPDVWNQWQANPLPATATSLHVTGLLHNHDYQFRVRCHNVYGYSDYSNIKTQNTFCVVPSVPQGLQRRIMSDTCIELEWQAAPNAELYWLSMLPPGSSSWQNVHGSIGLSSTTTRFTISGLQTGGQYQFRIRSSSVCDFSAYSTPVTITIVESLAVPSGVTADRYPTVSPNPPGVQDILITWNYPTSTLVSGFRVARLDPGMDENNQALWYSVGVINDPLARSFLDDNSTPGHPLSNGLIYKYRVRAFLDFSGGTNCSTVYSAYSNIDTASP